MVVQLTFEELWAPPRPPAPDPDDESFWGPGGKAHFLLCMRTRNILSIQRLAEEFGWELDNEYNPLPPPALYSMALLNGEGKVLMAHVLHDLGIFKSVGEAKRNGWNKPLELGDFTVTKKKIRFRIVE